ncbi:hypothetical protein CALVIDRAFT_568976 [Calocera viscosa TUFC12733]|uniref:Uncharacterized protein n=1 Tax=Calocera viscosa (strain TUFC12733) TaxID=1330018 RepID=A0A167GH44_CALVF|nr:hypothetical protein CALVIDRAFT_568976 [Calocera viscosa TUFC12733]
MADMPGNTTEKARIVESGMMSDEIYQSQQHLNEFRSLEGAKVNDVPTAQANTTPRSAPIRAAGDAQHQDHLMPAGVRLRDNPVAVTATRTAPVRAGDSDQHQDHLVPRVVRLRDGQVVVISTSGSQVHYVGGDQHQAHQDARIVGNQIVIVASSSAPAPSVREDNHEPQSNRFFKAPALGAPMTLSHTKSLGPVRTRSGLPVYLEDPLDAYWRKWDARKAAKSTKLVQPNWAPPEYQPAGSEHSENENDRYPPPYHVLGMDSARENTPTDAKAIFGKHTLNNIFGKAWRVSTSVRRNPSVGSYTRYVSIPMGDEEADDDLDQRGEGRGKNYCWWILSCLTGDN